MRPEHWVYTLPLRIRSLFRRQQVEQELDEEIQNHIERQTAANVAAGMSASDARAAALRAFGGVELYKEEARDTRGLALVDALGRDLRFAVRTLRRRPVFAAIACATMALGIGAATSIYSVVDGVLLRPLPFRDPGSLFAIWETDIDRKKNVVLAPNWDHGLLSLAQYRDLSGHMDSFEDLGLYAPGSLRLTSEDRSELVGNMVVTGALMDILRVHPAFGRTFKSSEDVPSGPQVAMISYEAWQERYGGTASILGRTMHFDGFDKYTIVGVLPRDFSLGRTSLPSVQPGAPQRVPEIWTLASPGRLVPPTAGVWWAVGRLKPGATVQGATAEIDAVLHPTTESRKTKGTKVIPWQADQTRDARGPLVLLFAAVGVLLLIACVNVAMLLLGEAAVREHEMAARLVLGATRGALIRQLLVESVVLALIGGTVGILIAAWGTHALVAFAPQDVPGLAGVHVNLRVLLFATVLSVCTGAAFGTAPALALSRTHPAATIHIGMGQSARGRGGLQRWMIASELALAVLLLVSAGLLERTMQRITHVDPGFRADHLLAVKPFPPLDVLRDSAELRRFRTEVMEQLAATAGITAVTTTNLSPFMGTGSGNPFSLDDEVPPDTTSAVPQPERHRALLRLAGVDYFSVLGVPVRAGRAFTAEDRRGTDNVVVVNEAIVRRDFGGASPINRRILYGGAWRTIVGVVGDVHWRRLSIGAEAVVYEPFDQVAPAFAIQTLLLIRTVGDPALMAGTVRRVIAQVEPHTIIANSDVMSDVMERTFAEERYRATLIMLFGAAATLLSAVGLYGVTSRSVARRMREVAIRRVLGASERSIARIVVGTTLAGVAIGISIGLVGALATSRMLTPYLFGVTTTDSVTYVTIAASLTLVSLVASWWPMRRARRVTR